MKANPRSLGSVTLTLVAAAALAVGGCDDAGDGTFECGADRCLGASEYCEVVLPDLSNTPISETCMSVPPECSALAPDVCSPDDDASEEARAECVRDSVLGASGFSWSCNTDERELYITIIVGT